MHDMRVVAAVALWLAVSGCFGDDAPELDAGIADAADIDAAAVPDAHVTDAGDGGDAGPCGCMDGEICVQYRRHEMRCLPLAQVPSWDTGRCGMQGQACCPLAVPEIGIATDVCRPGLVCQVVGFVPAESARCLP